VGLTLQPGKDSALTQTSEHMQAIAALLGRERFSGMDFEVELREGFVPRIADGTRRAQPAPVAILWQAERPLAVLAADLLTLAKAAPGPLREPLLAQAREAGLGIAHARESQLWSLMAAPPPRLRSVGAGRR